MNPTTPKPGFDWKGFFIGLGVLIVICCPLLWLPAWIVVVALDILDDRPSPDLRINDPVWDHRDHLGASRQPRVGQGQGSGLI